MISFFRNEDKVAASPARPKMGGMMRSLAKKILQQGEMVVCYKSIFINIFTIFVINVDHQSQDDTFSGTVVYRFEAFHIWET